MTSVQMALQYKQSKIYARKMPVFYIFHRFRWCCGCWCCFYTVTADAALVAAEAAAAVGAILLLKLLYNICRVPGLESEILRPQTGVLYTP